MHVVFILLPTKQTSEVPPRSVVIPGTYTKKFAAGKYQVACALIIGKRKESTDKKVSLNDALRVLTLLPKKSPYYFKVIRAFYILRQTSICDKISSNFLALFLLANLLKE